MSKRYAFLILVIFFLTLFVVFFLQKSYFVSKNQPLSEEEEKAYIISQMEEIEKDIRDWDENQEQKMQNQEMGIFLGKISQINEFFESGSRTFGVSFSKEGVIDQLLLENMGANKYFFADRIDMNVEEIFVSYDRQSPFFDESVEKSLEVGDYVAFFFPGDQEEYLYENIISQQVLYASKIMSLDGNQISN